MFDKQNWHELLKQAKTGDAVAQWQVGNLYSNGYIDSTQEVIVKQNSRLAVEWYEKAAEQENVDGMSSLAYHLDTGSGCNSDTEKAIRLYKMAIGKGSSVAASNLGTVYRDKGNYKKAFEYYDLSMRLEKSDYSFTVGLCYYCGVGVAQDKATAVRHFQKVCTDKLVLHTQYEQDLAHYYLGLSYLTGEGLKKSLKLASRHFEIANADNDNECALALLHLIGRNRIEK